MWCNWLCVAIGGAIGASGRYGISLLCSGTNAIVPLSTLTVNLLGSFIIGLLSSLFIALDAPTPVKLFSIVGILGGFTTYSSFAFDTAALLRSGDWIAAMLNVALNNIGAILLAFLGMIIGNYIFK